MKIYATDHQHSQVICRAFHEGCGGPIVSVGVSANDDSLVYGILRGCDDVMADTVRNGRDFYHVDHGYFGRGHYDGYYRITKNNTQKIVRDVPVFPDDRWRSLNIKVAPWKREGDIVAVVPPTRTFAAYAGLDVAHWTSVVKCEVGRTTGKQVVVCTKADRSFGEVLKLAFATVVYNSNAAIDSLVAGVPVVALGPSAARPVAWTFDDLADPYYPDREPLFRMLAYHQFSLNEMRNGTAWRVINEYY